MVGVVGTWYAAGGQRVPVRRGIAIAAGLVSVSGIVLFAAGADAAPQPSVSQVPQDKQLTTSSTRSASSSTRPASSCPPRRPSCPRSGAAARANASSDGAGNGRPPRRRRSRRTADHLVAGCSPQGPVRDAEAGSLLMGCRGTGARRPAAPPTPASWRGWSRRCRGPGRDPSASASCQYRSSLGKLIDTQKATLASPARSPAAAVTDKRSAPTSSAPQRYTGPPRPRRRRRSRSPTPEARLPVRVRRRFNATGV